jgi:hypothetical protein
MKDGILMDLLWFATSFVVNGVVRIGEISLVVERRALWVTAGAQVLRRGTFVVEPVASPLQLRITHDGLRSS